MVVDEKVKSLKMDMVSRHEIYVIFRRALRNIARNAHGAPILINVDFVKPRLSLKIQSSGNYGPIETLYDNEKINDISKRAESIKALLDIQSDNKKVSIILDVEV
jgi:signal transduction histidine kinase